MRYDRDGFRIPPEFVPPRDDFDIPGKPDSARGLWIDPLDGQGGRKSAAPPGRRPASRGKKLTLLAVAAAILVPGLLAPEIIPAIRETVVAWSLEEAARLEGGGDIPGALGAVDRAVAWQADDFRLHCLHGQLRLENRDPEGALAAADRAVGLAPTAPAPHRLRALANTVLGRPEDALADVQAVVDLNRPGDPEALTLRAYTRALLRRDLPAALDDIEQALGRTGEESPAHLDTRGYILHLLGRDLEAIDDLNRAIDGMQELRRRLMLARRQGDRIDFSQRLRITEHGLAVMHQHRALACRAAGYAEQAKQDFQVAAEKGFDPERGIF
jgi:tetratricopeptide (TPR) repeat protein